VEALAGILLDRLEEDVAPERFARSLHSSTELTSALGAAWPLLEPTDLVGDLWTVPAYLRMCAPWLDRDQVRRLQRRDAHAWTVSDLPLLDAARRRLGDPGASRRRRDREAAVAAERAAMATVVDDLVDGALELFDGREADLEGEGVVMMLRGEDLRSALVDDTVLARADPHPLAGPFAHVVVDEAQELTDAEWQMLLPRCPSRSLTIVGDRAQARHGFTESWAERLERVGLQRVDVATLGINYRTPVEVMAEAEAVIRAALPVANVPVSIRSTGVPVEHGPVSALEAILDSWVETSADGTACVIGTRDVGPSLASTRVRWLTPELSKGLEYDLVVLVDPESFGAGVEGSVDRYVAMTRATQRLVVLTSR
jgi:superfamily I DNA/RNA helicase